MEANTNKPRSDAWDAELTEAQRWQAYAQFRRSPWFEVSAWAEKEFNIPPPSRSALYRWSARMRGLESSHRLEQAIVAREEVGAMAESAGQSDGALIECYKTMGADIAMRTGDAKAAGQFIGMALKLSDAQRKRLELELKARAQGTKEESLQLAREKFQYDAAKAAMQHADKIKSIQADTTLSDDAKILATRKELFGEVPT